MNASSGQNIPQWLDTVAGYFRITKHFLSGECDYNSETHQSGRGGGMKFIETHLTEKQFLDRMDTLCRKKERFDRGYHDIDTFVVKRKRNKFRLGKHYAHVGRGDGYASVFLYCRYDITEKGYVRVSYRYGAPLIHLIPFAICVGVGGALCLSLLYEAVFDRTPEWASIFITSAMWIFGLVGLLFRSKKDRRALENHLLRVCRKEWETECL